MKKKQQQQLQNQTQTNKKPQIFSEAFSLDIRQYLERPQHNIVRPVTTLVFTFQVCSVFSSLGFFLFVRLFVCLFFGGAFLRYFDSNRTFPSKWPTFFFPCVCFHCEMQGWGEMLLSERNIYRPEKSLQPVVNLLLLVLAALKYLIKDLYDQIGILHSSVADWFSSPNVYCS